MVRTQIQLTEEQVAALKRMAMVRHVSMAELIRRAVDNLVKSGILVNEKERRKRAIEAAGLFHSGSRNLSLMHDQHLAEVFNK